MSLQSAFLEVFNFMLCFVLCGCRMAADSKQSPVPLYGGQPVNLRFIVDSTLHPSAISEQEKRAYIEAMNAWDKARLALRSAMNSRSATEDQLRTRQEQSDTASLGIKQFKDAGITATIACGVGVPATG
jgi:hypothetical protein